LVGGAAAGKILTRELVRALAVLFDAQQLVMARPPILAARHPIQP